MKAINITKLLLLSVLAVVFASCNNDDVLMDVKLKDPVNIKFDADVFSTASPLAFTVLSGENQFSGSTVLNREDAAFREIKPHLTNLSSININEALLTITEKVAGLDYSAEDIVITATAGGFSTTVGIPSYQFGDTFSSKQNAEFGEFLNRVLLQLMFVGGDVELSIEGKTNAIDGDKLNVHFQLADVLLKVKTLKKK